MSILPAGSACTCQGAAVRYSDAIQGTPGAHDTIGALTLVVVAWLVVIVGALLVMRAVMSEQLDQEQDQSDDQISGHVPSE